MTTEEKVLIGVGVGVLAWWAFSSSSPSYATARLPSQLGTPVPPPSGANVAAATASTLATVLKGLLTKGQTPNGTPVTDAKPSGGGGGGLGSGGGGGSSNLQPTGKTSQDGNPTGSGGGQNYGPPDPLSDTNGNLATVSGEDTDVAALALLNTGVVAPSDLGLGGGDTSGLIADAIANPPPGYETSVIDPSTTFENTALFGQQTEEDYSGYGGGYGGGDYQDENASWD